MLLTLRGLGIFLHMNIIFRVFFNRKVVLWHINLKLMPTMPILSVLTEISSSIYRLAYLSVHIKPFISLSICIDVSNILCAGWTRRSCFRDNQVAYYKCGASPTRMQLISIKGRSSVPTLNQTRRYMHLRPLDRFAR